MARNSRRLNSTAALQSMPVDCCEESVSVSTRRIDNGFVQRVSRSGPAGYTSTERYTRDAPAAGLPGQDPPTADSAGSTGLAGVKDELR